jgi:hypothetical protein
MPAGVKLDGQSQSLEERTGVLRSKTWGRSRFQWCAVCDIKKINVWGGGRFLEHVAVFLVRILFRVTLFFSDHCKHHQSVQLTLTRLPLFIMPSELRLGALLFAAVKADETSLMQDVKKSSKRKETKYQQ